MIISIAERSTSLAARPVVPARELENDKGNSSSGPIGEQTHLISQPNLR